MMQCSGKTNAGTTCQHSCNADDGFCHQHVDQKQDETKDVTVSFKALSVTKPKGCIDCATFTIPASVGLYHRTNVDKKEFYPDRSLNWFAVARVEDPEFGTQLYSYKTTRELYLLDLDFSDLSHPNVVKFVAFVRANGFPTFQGKQDRDFDVVCSFG